MKYSKQSRLPDWLPCRLHVSVADCNCVVPGHPAQPAVSKCKQTRDTRWSSVAQFSKGITALHSILFPNPALAKQSNVMRLLSKLKLPGACSHGCYGFYFFNSLLGKLLLYREKGGEMQKREKEIEQRNCPTTIMGIHTAYVVKEI